MLRREHLAGSERGATDSDSKIDSFCDYIRQRVSEFDLSPTRILSEIQSMGYTGGVHTVRRYVRSLKQDSQRKTTATVRFETPPGKQAQCDWGHVGKFPDATGRMVDISLFVIVLGYSRQMYVRFTTSMKIPALVDCHQHAFEYFEGIPQTILYDNMSQVRTGPGRLNATFRDFSEHCGFDVSTHRPFRPRTKGKVERMVDYVKQNLLNGRTFDGLDDLNRQGIEWLDTVANVRVHGTTGRVPRELWLEEKDQLVDIAQLRLRPWSPVIRVERRVSKDSLVVFDRSRYSVPPEHVGTTVEVCSANGTITVRCKDAIIAEHPRSTDPGKSITKPEHLEELWRSTLGHVPLTGAPHCNVRLDETVAQCSLSVYEEVCS